MPTALLPIPHHKQSQSGACLPACARMVLGYLGHDVTETHLAQVMGSYWYGTPASRVRRLSSFRSWPRPSSTPFALHLSKHVFLLQSKAKGGQIASQGRFP